MSNFEVLFSKKLGFFPILYLKIFVYRDVLAPLISNKWSQLVIILAFTAYLVSVEGNITVNLSGPPGAPCKRID